MLNIEGHFRKKFGFLTGSLAVIVARKLVPGTTARRDSFQKFIRNWPPEIRSLISKRSHPSAMTTGWISTPELPSPVPVIQD
jgi:hypothetical protein